MALRIENKAAVRRKKLRWCNAVDTDFLDKTNELKLQSCYLPSISYTHHTHIQAADVDNAPIQHLIHRELEYKPGLIAPIG